MSRDITAVQRVWGIAELRDLIYHEMDPMTLLNHLANDFTEYEIYHSRALKKKLYLSQLPEIPIEEPDYDESRPYMYSQWSPNRILLPTDTSTFTFRVDSLPDFAFTIRRAWRGDSIGDGRPEIFSGPNEEPLCNAEVLAEGPFDICYPVIQCDVGPAYDIPDWARTMPQRVIDESLKKPLMTDPPLSAGVLRTMLIDRATETLILYNNTTKDIHGKLKNGRMTQRVLPGTTLGDLVAQVEKSRADIELYRDWDDVHKIAEEGELFSEMQAEYRRNLMAEKAPREAKARETNGVPSIFGQDDEYYEKLYNQLRIKNGA